MTQTIFLSTRRGLGSTPLAALLFSMLVLVTGVPNSSAAVDDRGPGAIFESCVTHIELLQRRCINEMEDQTIVCIRVIRELLHNGNIERAHHVARECVLGLHHQAHVCNLAIRESCERCINRLLDLGAEELAMRLRHRCHQATADVTFASYRFAHQILNQFDR